ncbi:MAG: hypothetical protein LBE16_00280 [Clostridiales Family XIII bacterium]|jgi:hypothetical protein|nr:hypothetical protein [Clostridiales Family XIII bacterium]
MGIDELLRLLEIEDFEEFGFFEYYAELVENEREIPFETLREFFVAVDRKTLAELTEGYFEETLANAPDDQTEFYLLLDSIGRNMTRLARCAADRGPDLFTEEFLRFRQWYIFDRAVRCENKNTGIKSDVGVCEALMLARLERLGGADYFFDFRDCMDYPIEASVYPIDELAEDAYAYSDEEEE